METRGEKALGDLKAPSSASRGSKRSGEGLWIRVWNDKTRGNGFELAENRFRLDFRKKFLVARVMRRWHCQEKMWMPHP